MNSVVIGLVAGHKRDGRCKYDPQAKQELILRCLNPGVSVSRMAMQHGVNANLLRSWITKDQRTTIGVADPIQADVPGTTPEFVPVQLESSAPPIRIKAPPPATRGPSNMPTPVMRLQVHLPNGVDLDIDTAQAGQFMEVMQMLSNPPCSN
jgi:transposase-like protein